MRCDLMHIFLLMRHDTKCLRKCVLIERKWNILRLLENVIVSECIEVFL